MHPPERRDAVRAAYVHQRQPLEAAAKIGGVAYQTARQWKRAAKAQGADWDRARGAARMASGGLGDLTAQVLEDFAILFSTTMEQLKSPGVDPLDRAEAMSRLSDSYVKVVKAAGNASPPLAELSVAMRVLSELSTYIRDNHPGDLPRFAAILEPFGQRLAQVLG
jgi:hypothetical protein